MIVLEILDMYKIVHLGFSFGKKTQKFMMDIGKKHVLKLLRMAQKLKVLSACSLSRFLQ